MASTVLAFSIHDGRIGCVLATIAYVEKKPSKTVIGIIYNEARPVGNDTDTEALSDLMAKQALMHDRASLAIIAPRGTEEIVNAYFPFMRVRYSQPELSDKYYAAGLKTWERLGGHHQDYVLIHALGCIELLSQSGIM